MKISLLRNICLLILLFVLSLSDRTSAADWAANFGGSPGTHAYIQATATDASGNIYLTGYFDGATLTFGSIILTKIGSRDAFVAKMDASGTVLWAKDFGGNGAYSSSNSVAVDGNGFIYIVGDLSGNNLTTPALTKIGSQDAFAIKLDASGETVWAKNFGGSGASAFSHGIAVDSSSNTYIAGFFQSADFTNPALTLAGSQDAFAIKLDAAGTISWAKRFGGSGASTVFRCVAVDGNGSVYLGGWFEGANLTTPAVAKIGTQDALALKLDANGATTWAKNFGGSWASVYGMGITVDTSRNVYLGGFFQSANLTNPTLTKIGIDDAFVFKLDSTGATTWAKNFGGSGAWTRGFGIAVDGSYNAYLGGWLQGANLTAPALTKIGTQDAFAFKLDSTGTTTWAKNFGGSGATAFGLGIAVNGSGNVLLGGYFDSANITIPALTKNAATDAFIIYTQYPYGRTVTATVGANGTIASTNPLTVNTDATGSFTLSPNATYQPAATVSGDCPAGSWNGNTYTTGAITADCTVGFNFTRITYPLTLSATGTGTITATAAGYGDQTCSGNCGYSYDINTVVTLTPNPGTGFTFTGWGGACSGSGSCQTTMDSVKDVTATFNAAPLPEPELVYTALPNVWDLMGNDLGEVVWIQNDGTGNQVYSNIHGQITTNAT
ncbi:MAG: SBBP repeat-containing protein, partial [Geobacteraceae bacterium]|nr:SBBP repeat-containing protein [Geobacteraceae bacterium]